MLTRGYFSMRYFEKDSKGNIGVIQGIARIGMAGVMENLCRFFVSQARSFILDR